MEIAQAIPTFAAQRRRSEFFRFLPGLLAKHEMAKTVDPGAPENLYPENACKGSVTK